MIVQDLDGLSVCLREPHDLTFLSRWGRVFRVFDQQDSGNLCFGIEGPELKVFVKYAGAPTVRYEGAVPAAVAQGRRSVEVYRSLAHPTLTRLHEAADVGLGHAMVFDWIDAVPLGRQYEQSHLLATLSLPQRVDAVQQIYDFHVHAAAVGWVAVDFYDGSILVEPSTGRVTLCDLDFYERAPVTNRMGRMWGSSRFMSPEEYELGAVIDQVTNVFALGAVAHSFLGDDRTKRRDAWIGSDEQYQIAARALQPVREDRWGSIAELAAAWRESI